MRAFLFTFTALLGFVTIGCGGSEELAVEDTTQPLDGQAWCVDHPCPDLIPVKFSECPKYGSSMVVRIKNQWNLGAGSSKTRFTVDWSGSWDYATGPIAASQTVQLIVPLPSRCLVAPGCAWHVKADALDQVNETSGTNNTISGACIY